MDLYFFLQQYFCKIECQMKLHKNWKLCMLYSSDTLNNVTEISNEINDINFHFQ